MIPTPHGVTLPANPIRMQRVGFVAFMRLAHIRPQAVHDSFRAPPASDSGWMNADDDSARMRALLHAIPPAGAAVARAVAVAPCGDASSGGSPPPPPSVRLHGSAPSALERLTGVRASDAAGGSDVDGVVTGGPRPAGPDAGPDADAGPRAGAGAMHAGSVGRHTRSSPRLRLSATHAAVVMLLLVAALTASLTMLLQQSVAMSALDGGDGARAAASAPHTPGETLGGVESAEPSATATVTVTATPDAMSDATPGETADAAPGPAGESDAPEASARAPDDGRVDLNTAGVDELDGVTGIGPAIARRIVDYRSEHGPFASVDDLLDVPGIGVRTLAKMRDELTVRR